ncbi:monooxygenase [Friedmanniomyces endolithicus]|nr:monooxygenase [Friedmanniomyces endolithicus]
MGSLPAERRFNVDSVCIIGAGPSGLVAAKYLVAEHAFSRIQIYEQRSTPGGIWNYVPHQSFGCRDIDVTQADARAGTDRPLWHWKDAAGVPDNQLPEETVFMTPLYDQLETNIPRDLMGFSDLDWPKDSQLFPRHETVLDICLTEDARWRVRTRDLSHRDVTESEEIFDAVVVANGHFNIPYIPEVQGMEEWSAAYPGSISHSKLYRTPDQYAEKKVIVVGNSASGVDIGSQIQRSCSPPLLMSSKSESFLVNTPSPDKIDKPPIAEFLTKNRSVRFEDGTIEQDVDAILYCTGYFYSFPFLKSLDPPVVTSGERVENLYQHIFYQPHPTLAFPVLNQKVIPFPLAEAQAAVIARVFSGRLGLPYEDEMKTWEQDWTKKNGDARMFHVLKFPADADYIDELHDWVVSADGEGEVVTPSDEPSRGVVVRRGKTPPYWGEKEYWMRERFPAIKKAFQDMGEERHRKRTLQDVGFDYEKWKGREGG